eukprot:PhF_6_TR23291/c0_g1_i3/m.32834
MSHIEIFTAQGTKPLAQLMKMSCPKLVKREYDKSCRSNVVLLEGTTPTQCTVQFITTNQLTGTHPVLFVQMNCNPGDVLLELHVTDGSGTKRRVSFTNNAKGVIEECFHLRLPFAALPRSVWCNVYLHVGCILGSHGFRSVDRIALGPSLRLRRVFAMRELNPLDVPKGAEFVTGVVCETIVISDGTECATPTPTPSRGMGGADPISGKKKLLQPDVMVAFGRRVMPVSTPTPRLDGDQPLTGNARHADVSNTSWEETPQYIQNDSGLVINPSRQGQGSRAPTAPAVIRGSGQMNPSMMYHTVYPTSSSPNPSNAEPQTQPQKTQSPPSHEQHQQRRTQQSNVVRKGGDKILKEKGYDPRRYGDTDTSVHDDCSTADVSSLSQGGQPNIGTVQSSNSTSASRNLRNFSESIHEASTLHSAREMLPDPPAVFGTQVGRHGGSVHSSLTQDAQPVQSQNISQVSEEELNPQQLLRGSVSTTTSLNALRETLFQDVTSSQTAMLKHSSVHSSVRSMQDTAALRDSAIPPHIRNRDSAPVHQSVQSFVDPPSHRHSTDNVIDSKNASYRSTLMGINQQKAAIEEEAEFYAHMAGSSSGHDVDNFQIHEGCPEDCYDETQEELEDVSRHSIHKTALSQPLVCEDAAQRVSTDIVEDQYEHIPTQSARAERYQTTDDSPHDVPPPQNDDDVTEDIIPSSTTDNNYEEEQEEYDQDNDDGTYDGGDDQYYGEEGDQMASQSGGAGVGEVARLLDFSGTNSSMHTSVDPVRALNFSTVTASGQGFDGVRNSVQAEGGPGAVVRRSATDVKTARVSKVFDHVLGLYYNPKTNTYIVDDM